MNARLTGTDVTNSGIRFQYLMTLRVGLLLLLRVLPVCWTSLRDDPLSLGLRFSRERIVRAPSFSS